MHHAEHPGIVPGKKKKGTGDIMISPKYIKRALEVSSAKIRLAEARIIALNFAMSGEREKSQIRGDVQKEFSALHEILYKDLNDCYRTFFMWSNLNGDEAIKEANQKALKYYLKEGSEIMHYLGFTGTYKTLDETLFREELDELNKSTEN